MYVSPYKGSDLPQKNWKHVAYTMYNPEAQFAFN